MFYIFYKYHSQVSNKCVIRRYNHELITSFTSTEVSAQPKYKLIFSHVVSYMTHPDFTNCVFDAGISYMWIIISSKFDQVPIVSADL